MQEVVTEARAKPFAQWDVNEVCRLVQSIDGVGFAEAAKAIKENGIDGEVFLQLLRDNDDDLTTSIEEGGLGFKRLQLKVVNAKIDKSQAAESWKDKSDAHLAGGSTSAEKSANDKSTSQQPQINELQKVLSCCYLHKIMENAAFIFHAILPLLMHCTAENVEVAAVGTPMQQTDLAFESADVKSCLLDKTAADPSAAVSSTICCYTGCCCAA